MWLSLHTQTRTAYWLYTVSRIRVLLYKECNTPSRKTVKKVGILVPAEATEQIVRVWTLWSHSSTSNPRSIPALSSGTVGKVSLSTNKKTEGRVIPIYITSSGDGERNQCLKHLEQYDKYRWLRGAPSHVGLLRVRKLFHLLLDRTYYCPLSIGKRQ